MKAFLARALGISVVAWILAAALFLRAYNYFAQSSSDLEGPLKEEAERDLHEDKVQAINVGSDGTILAVVVALGMAVRDWRRKGGRWFDRT